MDFKALMQKRYAVKVFNKKSVPEEKIEEIKEVIRLSPSSFGLQPWKVYIVTSQTQKASLTSVTWNQKQIETCSHLFIFCAIQNLESHINSYEKLLIKEDYSEERAKLFTNTIRNFVTHSSKEQHSSWAQKQIYIALANAMSAASSLGLDSCPMEGFNPEEYAKILTIPAEEIPTVLLPIGYAADSPKKKIRFPLSEMFKNLS